jgi:hypothetical protein
MGVCWVGIIIFFLKMEELREIYSSTKLALKTNYHYDEFNKWLVSVGLLHNRRTCNGCGEEFNCVVKKK